MSPQALVIDESRQLRVQPYDVFNSAIDMIVALRFVHDCKGQHTATLQTTAHEPSVAAAEMLVLQPPLQFSLRQLLNFHLPEGQAVLHGGAPEARQFIVELGLYLHLQRPTFLQSPYDFCAGSL